MVSPMHARRCLLCYSFVWYCYISCTSHRPVTALGRLEARIPLVGHHKVNWAMKLIPTVTGKVRPSQGRGGSRPGRRSSAWQAHAHAAHAAAASRAPGHLPPAIDSDGLQLVFLLQLFFRSGAWPRQPLEFLRRLRPLQMPSPQASVPPSGCGKAIDAH